MLASRVSQQTIQRMTQLVLDALSDPGKFANEALNLQHNNLMSDLCTELCVSQSLQPFHDIRYIVGRYILHVDGNPALVTPDLTKDILSDIFAEFLAASSATNPQYFWCVFIGLGVDPSNCPDILGTMNIPARRGAKQVVIGPLRQGERVMLRILDHGVQAVGPSIDISSNDIYVKYTCLGKSGSYGSPADLSALYNEFNEWVAL